jgi:hypothetical protein
MSRPLTSRTGVCTSHRVLQHTGRAGKAELLRKKDMIRVTFSLERAAPHRFDNLQIDDMK